jgi:hypothetical protein
MKKTVIIFGSIAVILLAVLYSYYQTISVDPVTLETATPEQTPTPTVTSTPAPTAVNFTDDVVKYDQTLQSVNFCGIVNTSPRIYVDGINIIDKISNIANNSLIPTDLQDNNTIDDGIAQQICNNVNTNTKNGEITMHIETYAPFDQINTGSVNQKIYRIFMLQPIQIAIPSGDIYLLSGFDHSSMEPIGNIYKK